MKANIDSIQSNKMFPFSTEKGGDSSGINHQKMKVMAEYGPKLKQEHIEKLLLLHHDFLSGGGAGGRWKALQLGDIVVGFYDWKNIEQGEQAIFERMNLSAISLYRLEFPFANFCGVYANKANFKACNLSYSLCTDAILSKVNFEGAYLKNVDFSRSDLSGARFVNANLSGVDFENCDLRGADFSGAKFDTARFPGANLKDVNY